MHFIYLLLIFLKLYSWIWTASLKNSNFSLKDWFRINKILICITSFLFFFPQRLFQTCFKQKHFTLKENSNYSRYVRWSFLCVCESRRCNWRGTFVCCYSITKTTLCTMEVLKEDLHNHNVIPSLCSAFVGENYIHLNRAWKITSRV